MVKTRAVTSGGWRTLEWFWNQKATAFFRSPAGAQVKVRYGYDWLGWDSQKQTLDDSAIKRLTIGLAAIAYATIQINVRADTNVTYDVYPGETIAVPKVPF
jgi:hypothetical protein